jgi:hypothetical protein
MRRSGRAQVWRDGWRNLHTAGDSRISVELTADGQPGVIRITLDWTAGSGLNGAESFVQASGAPRQPLTAQNWSATLELFRPFLSYSELGGLVSGKPSEMYDALQAILGLDQLISAEKRLNDARKRLDEPSKQAAKALPALRASLDGHADERARRAAAAVKRRPWDLDTIEALALGADAGSDLVASRLSQVAAITLPSAERAEEVIGELVGASRQVADLQGTPAAEARRLAGLLGTALAHHADHPGQPCPVCGGRAMDKQWAEDTRTEVKRLNGIAQEADEAQAELATALRALQDLISSEPLVLTEDLGSEVTAATAAATWKSWASLTSDGTVEDLISSASQRFDAVASALAQLQAQAAGVLKRRSEAWQPIAAALASWAELARSSQRADADLAEVKAAIAWLREAGQEIRDARMAPLTEMSARVWGLLRQESNVDLGPVRLVGSATQRHVSLDVTVDGVPGAALSVMSQGELHALGLALFLPRATLPDSPFRFIVIDDPVQSMDPAKVDGLARLLAQVGKDRQVVVFTHDDRLPEAIRRLQLSATIWDVTRREGSVVELTKNQDPVFRYLDDARAMARTIELPEEVRAVVVAGLCRSALEAACQEVLRARRINAGARHATVERELAEAQKLRQILALAIFDDVSQGGQVVTALRSRYGGQAAVNVFDAAKEGTHAIYQGDLRHLVEDTARLVAALRA